MMTIKVGIIGCGGIANGKHMPSLQKVENVEMTAFCDVDISKAACAAEAYSTDNAKVYDDYKTLLKMTRLMLSMFVRQMIRIVKLL